MPEQRVDRERVAFQGRNSPSIARYEIESCLPLPRSFLRMIRNTCSTRTLDNTKTCSQSKIAAKEATPLSSGFTTAFFVR